MGIRGSATCALNFEDATGYLIGTENRGMAAMFRMMNIERLTVGMQGLGFAEIAYQNALAYALDRRQSKAPAPRPDPGKPADPIAYQPEIKRQLLTMRAQIEGARALATYAAMQADIMEKSGDAAVAAAAADTVGLLTPVIKAYFSDLGMSCTLSAQQIYGGYGYIREYGMEQLVRDCRITPIYEGTNEVQALDLVARKLTGSTGELADRLLAELLAFAEQHDDKAAAAAMQRLLEATAWIRDRHASNDAAVRGVATQYLRLFGLAVIGCLWTRAVVATQGKNGSFYTNKRKVARFYAAQILPETESLLAAITGGETALAEFAVADFSD
jgi:alkylation response protein AidB-like acyl-CoA dehydrogenase